MPESTEKIEIHPLLLYPLTKKQKKQLAGRGITIAEYHWFVEHFVGHNFDFCLKKGKADWFLTRKKPLSHAVVVSHLLGGRWLATGSRWSVELKKHWTRFIVIDLDRSESSKAADLDDLWERYEKVRTGLGDPTLVFQSSDSGGLHMYYLLDQPQELHRLRTPRGDGAVIRILAECGLLEAPGRMEVYPRGQYRGAGVQNRLRVAFGSQSKLLDVDHPTGFSTGASAISSARSSIATGSAPRANAVEWIDRGWKLTRPATELVISQEARTSVATRVPVDIDRLWSEGLTSSGQFNGAIGQLAVNLHCLGFSCDEAASHLCTWIDEKNNGVSLTYARSPERAYEEIRCVVGRIFAKPRSAGFWPPLPSLSEFEACSALRPIIDLTHPKELKRFKVELLALECVRRAKQWVLKCGLHAFETSAAKLGADSIGTSAFAKLLTLQLRSCWPDSTSTNFVVPIPYTMRLNIPGISESAQAPIWRALVSAGSFPMVRRSSAQMHRASTYRVQLDFGARSRWGEAPNIECALSSMFGASEHRQRYGSYYAKRIERSAGELVAPSRDPFSEFAREHLQGATSTIRRAAA